MGTNEYLDQILRAAALHNKEINHEAFFADVKPLLDQFQNIVRLYGYEGHVSMSVTADGYFNVTAPGFYFHQVPGYPTRFEREVA